MPALHVIDDFETNTVEVFLAKNRFSDYIEKFLEGGCGDFSFVINLDESDILEMQKDVGMTKVGGVKKFVAAKIQKETSAGLPTRCKFHFYLAIFWHVCLVCFFELILSQISHACSA